MAMEMLLRRPRKCMQGSSEEEPLFPYNLRLEITNFTVFVVVVRLSTPLVPFSTDNGNG